MDMGLVHRAVCLFTPQLSLVLTAPTYGGMARLSWPWWLAAHRDCPDGHPSSTNRARRRSTAFIRTNAL